MWLQSTSHEPINEKRDFAASSGSTGNTSDTTARPHADYYSPG